MKTQNTIVRVIDENADGYYVCMMYAGRVIQTLLHTYNRQHAYRVAEKYNGKRRTTERDNKNVERLIFEQH